MTRACLSNGSKLIIVDRTSKEVGRAKYELVKSYWPVLVFICIFSSGNAYSEVRICNNSIRPCTLNNAFFRLYPLAKGKVYKTQLGQNSSRSIFSHCQTLGFLPSPYLVVSGNANRMLHIYTSGEIYGFLVLSSCSSICDENLKLEKSFCVMQLIV